MTIQRMTVIFVSLLGVGGICCPKASGQTQPSEQRRRIYGTVINAVTHEPIGRALVCSQDNRFAMLTDGEGHFEFTVPKTDAEATRDSSISYCVSGHSRDALAGPMAGGVAWLTARKPGFLNDPNEPHSIEALLDRNLVLPLMPEAVIKGRVTAMASDAAAGVNVQIFSTQVRDGMTHWIASASGRTNSNGEFRFSELLPGTYKVVTHEWMDNDPVARVPNGQFYGFPPVFYPNATDVAAAGTIQLAAGQIYQADISIIRQPYYPVTIPVATSESKAGLSIAVSLQEHRSLGYSLGYNSAKQTIDGLLPKGKYLVEAKGYGPSLVSGSVSLIVAGAPAEGPTMVLIPGHSVEVHVVEKFTATEGNHSMTWNVGHGTFVVRGPRLSVANIQLEPADDFGPTGGASLRPPTGPNDEALVIENLEPGQYWLRLRPSRGYLASATSGGVDLLSHPLLIGGGASAPIEIELRDDTAEIDGTVADILESAPINGAGFGQEPPVPRVWIYSVPLGDGRGQFEESMASGDGKFNLQNLAPGTYRVMAFKNQQANLPYRDAEAMRAYEAKGQVVHLSPGLKATVQLHVVSTSD
jgi:hypothetical protein